MGEQFEDPDECCFSDQLKGKIHDKNYLMLHAYVRGVAIETELAG